MIQLDELLAATGGYLNQSTGATAFESFCFDSRLVQPGQLFMAVRTDRADGHDYIRAACAGGATGVLCQNPIDVSEFGAACIVVNDTRLAVQEWARYTLARRGMQVIGITGSVGKTTAKEAIAAVLAARFPVFKNRANYNGLYGLPIALGELAPGDQVAVLEMAADHFGEIAALCRIAPPEIAVVTTVEPAHLEVFGSLDAIAREKGDLVQALPTGGLAVLNADDRRVLAMRQRTGARVVTIGTERSYDTEDSFHPDILAHEILVTREGLIFTVDSPAGGLRVHLPLLGRHQVYAALAAVAVGIEFGLDLDALAGALAALPYLPGRMHPLPGRRGSLILDDTYSSSPAAVDAALETLAALEGRRRIAVLGDMLELGAHEAAGHEQAGRRAAVSADLLVTKGERARRIADGARAAGLNGDQVIVTYTAEDAARAVLDRLGPGDVVLVKGSLATRMEQVVRLLLDDPDAASDLLVRQDAGWQGTVTVSPERPTWLEIDLGAIAHNVRRLDELAGDARLMISLKADAYGHGAVQVAHTALLNGATWLGVACINEGAVLRRAGIAAPILVLGYTPAWQARDILRHDLTATIFDLEIASALSRAALALDREVRVHVKVETGMGRLGVFPSALVDLVRTLRDLPGLIVEGVFTHLSVADGLSEWESVYSARQLELFDGALAELAAAGIEIPWVHVANSAALLQAAGDGMRKSTGPAGERRLSPRVGNLVRTGIAVYGLDPSSEVRCPEDFRPALSWKTQVAQVKELPSGSRVGYGGTYVTQGVERIATIPVGYADGFRRSPQNWGEVLVRGRRAPLVGRVCMDQTMINVSYIPDVRQGDEVVLIGRQGEDRITAEEVAARLGTINYEVVSAILARVPREGVA